MLCTCTKMTLTAVIAILAGAALAGGLALSRSRSTGPPDAAPDGRWTTLEQRTRLGRESVWTLALERDLAAGETLRLHLLGQTSAVEVSLGSGDVRVDERFAAERTEKRGGAPWPQRLRAGDRLHVAQAVDFVSVHLNAVRVLAVPTPVQRIRKAVWATAGGNALSPAVLSYQRVAPLVFRDDFMHDDDDLGPWQAKSGTWSVHTLRNPIRSANAFSLLGHGADARVLTGHWFWRNYTVRCAVQPHTASSFGVFFSHLDDDHYYMVRWQTPASGGAQTVELVRRVGDVDTILGAAEQRYAASQWYHLDVTHLEGWIQVCFDERPIIETVDPAPLVSGAAGLWSDGALGTVFDDVEITAAGRLRTRFDPARAAPPTISWAGDTTAGSDGMRFGHQPATMAIHGLPTQNAEISAWFSGLNAAQSPLELWVRRIGDTESVTFRIVPDRSGGAVGTLTVTEGGSSRILAHSRLDALPDHPARVTLTADGRDATATVDGRILCVSSDLRSVNEGMLGLTSRGANPETAVVAVDAGRAVAIPSIDNRVEAFTHEESMQNWSNPASEWLARGTSRGLVHWHRSDFWRGIEVEVDAEQLPERGFGSVWGLVLGFPDVAGSAGGAQVRLIAAPAEAGWTVSLELPDTDPVVATTEHRPRLVGLARRGDRIVARLNGRVMALGDAPGGAAALAQAGRVGTGSADTWAEAITIRADGVETYSFSQAPADWLPVAGIWEVTSRWQCDERWSFYSGTQRGGVACNWGKLRHGANVTLEFFAGPRMDRERGDKYEYAADLNAVIAADGNDITSGYSIMYGGWNDSGSFIVRGDKVLSRNSGAVIPRSSAIHRRWFHVKVRKQAGTITLWVDNVQVAKAQDPQPLTGDRFGIWTYDNGMMVAHVRVSSDAPERLLAELPNDLKRPKTPYDK